MAFARGLVPPGASRAPALRWAADGKASTVAPTSATITAAPWGLPPGAVRRSAVAATSRRAIADAKAARRVSGLSMPSRIVVIISRWWGVRIPVRAATKASGDAFTGPTP